MGKVKILFAKQKIKNIPFLSPIKGADPGIAKEQKKAKKIEEITAYQTTRRKIKHMYRAEGQRQVLFENALRNNLAQNNIKQVDEYYDKRIKELENRGQYNTSLVTNYKVKEDVLINVLRNIVTSQKPPKPEHYVQGQYRYQNSKNETMGYEEPVVAYIAETLRDKWTKMLDRDAMVGVLITEDGTCYVTISGKTTDQKLYTNPDLDIPGIQLGKVVFVHDSRIGLDSASSDDEVHIDIGGKTLKVKAKENSIVGCCAAPKLWVYAVNHGHVPLAFSEYKTDGSPKQRESCGNCQALMPKLLEATQDLYKSMEKEINKGFAEDVVEMKKRKQAFDQMIEKEGGAKKLQEWNNIIAAVVKLAKTIEQDESYQSTKNNLGKNEERDQFLKEVDIILNLLRRVVELMRRSSPLAIEQLSKRKEMLLTIAQEFEQAKKLLLSWVDKTITYITGLGWVNKEVKYKLFENFNKNNELLFLNKTLPNLV